MEPSVSIILDFFKGRRLLASSPTPTFMFEGPTWLFIMVPTNRVCDFEFPHNQGQAMGHTKAELDSRSVCKQYQEGPAALKKMEKQQTGSKYRQE